MTGAVWPTGAPPLSELKVVVKHDMPRDELWVHPAMFDLLQRALQEADSNRPWSMQNVR